MIKKIKQERDAFEYLSYIFNIIENNPELDYGMPGPIVHFMESYYENGYEEILLKPVQKNNNSYYMDAE